MKAKHVSIKNEVWVPVEGTIVNWKTERQVHPETGDSYDFQGRPVIDDHPHAHTEKHAATKKDKP